MVMRTGWLEHGDACVAACRHAVPPITKCDQINNPPQGPFTYAMSSENFDPRQSDGIVSHLHNADFYARRPMAPAEPPIFCAYRAAIRRCLC